MATKKKLNEDQATDNAATVQMKPNKATAMAQAVTMLGAMSGDDLTRLVQVLQQNSASAAASIPDDAAAKNAATVAMKEDLEIIFGGEELAEDFKEKITTLFESAVSTRVQLEVATLSEQFEERLNEQTKEVMEELVDNLDKYASYLAEQWLEENAVAIESSMRTEIAESFISGLKDLFNEHYISIPDEKIDALEEYEANIAELQEQLNDALNQNIALEEQLANSILEDVFEEVSTGLPMTHVSKFRTLAEGIEFTGDVDTYKRKLNIIKEKHFTKKTSEASNVLNESFEGDISEDIIASPSVKAYAEAISRTVKK